MLKIRIRTSGMQDVEDPECNSRGAVRLQCSCTAMLVQLCPAGCVSCAFGIGTY